MLLRGQSVLLRGPVPWKIIWTAPGIRRTRIRSSLRPTLFGNAAGDRARAAAGGVARRGGLSPRGPGRERG